MLLLPGEKSHLPLIELLGGRVSRRCRCGGGRLGQSEAAVGQGGHQRRLAGRRGRTQREGAAAAVMAARETAQAAADPAARPQTVNGGRQAGRGQRVVPAGRDGSFRQTDWLARNGVHTMIF